MCSRAATSELRCTPHGRRPQLWRDIQANLERVDQPLLIFKSVTDRVVDPSSLALIKDRSAID